jgi:hypothetical protein
MAMSNEHKAALAQGRLEARAVKAYLASLGPKKRGRPVTKDSLQKKISDIDSKLKTEANPLRRLDLLQSRAETESSLDNLGSGPDQAALAADYATWREFGVSADVLRKAGIPQTRRRAS